MADTMIGGSAFPKTSTPTVTPPSDSAAIAVAVTASLIASGVGISQMVALPLIVTDTDGSAVGGTNSQRITLRVGDTAPMRRVQVVDAAGRPVSLVGATARYHMIALGASAGTVNAPAVVEVGAGGYLRYAWIAANTATPGLYRETWTVTNADGTVFTVPGSGSIIIEIIP